MKSFGRFLKNYWLSGKKSVRRSFYLRFILSTGATLFIFILIFQKINIFGVIGSIKKANFTILFIALILSIIQSIFFNPYRWKLILRNLGCSISLRESAFINISCVPIADIIPLRVGEFSRVLYLRRLRNIAYSKAVFSIFCEYVSSFLAVFVFIFMGLIAYLIRNIGFVILSQISPLVLFSLHLEKKPQYFANAWKNFLSKFFIPFVAHLKDTGKILSDFKICCCAFLSIGSELIVVYLLAKSLGFSLPVYAVLLYTPLVILAGHIPLTIAGLGIREVATLFFFIKFASAGQLFSLGILYSFIGYLFPIILGISLTSLFLNKIIWAQDNKKITLGKA